MQVGVQIERRQIAGLLLAVDAAMDGEGWMACVQRENLGGSPRGRHEHQLLPERQQRLHHCSSQRGLAGAGRTAQNHRRLVAPVGHKHGQHADGMLLFGSRHVAKVLANTVFQFVFNQLFPLFSALFQGFFVPLQRNPTAKVQKIFEKAWQRQETFSDND